MYIDKFNNTDLVMRYLININILNLKRQRFVYMDGEFLKPLTKLDIKPSEVIKYLEDKDYRLWSALRLYYIYQVNFSHGILKKIDEVMSTLKNTKYLLKKRYKELGIELLKKFILFVCYVFREDGVGNLV